jgi:hypothetical protein
VYVLAYISGSTARKGAEMVKNVARKELNRATRPQPLNSSNAGSNNIML